MSARQIDPSARIDAAAAIGKDVSIGPYCTIGPHVSLGDGCRLLSHVNITGHTSIGPRTVIAPFASLGGPPQSVHYRGGPTKLVVGADCDIREHVTMNTGTEDDRGETVVGDKCFFMVNSHVAHDCQVGNNVVFANNAVLAGHCTVGNNVVFGGGSAVLQFVRIGHGAMIGGISGIRADIIPWGYAIGQIADLVGLNIVGMRRAGLSKTDILTARRAYRALFFGEGSFRARIDAVEREFGGDARVRQIVDFLRAGGDRPVTMAVKRRKGDED
jgi:UDP-N-acetylglucosamine acyltransferase